MKEEEGEGKKIILSVCNRGRKQEEREKKSYGGKKDKKAKRKKDANQNTKRETTIVDQI